jgi:hypothetical protein
VLTDALAKVSRTDFGGKSFPLEFPGGAQERQQLVEIFEIMARMDHPDAESVLTMLGRRSDDKQAAKAARRAAYKASTRRAARS